MGVGSQSDCSPFRRAKWGQALQWPAGIGLLNGASNTPAYAINNGPGGTLLGAPRQVLASASIDTDAPPIEWAVQLGVSYNNGLQGRPNNIPVGSRAQVTAIVTWGALGGDQVAAVDVTDGTTLSVVGHSVKVEIADESIYVGNVPAASPFTVTASISPNAPMPSKATRTIVCDQVFGGVNNPGNQLAGVLLFIPPFAKAVSVRRIDSTLAISNYTLQLADGAGILLDTIAIPAGAELNNFTLPGTASMFTVSVGANVTRISLVFDLDL